MATGRRRRVGARIIVVDDDHDNREMVRELLDGAGLEVRAFPSAESAIEVLTHGEADVVFTDLGLRGGMSGYSFARWLRAMPAMRRVAIVAISGTFEHAPEDAVLFDRFLGKPVDVAEIVRIARELVADRARARR